LAEEQIAMGASRTFLTRRGFGKGISGIATMLGVAGPSGTVANSVLASDAGLPDPALHDAALRGLALAGHRGDPVAAANAEVVLARLAQTDPESTLLVRIYQALDVRPAAYWHDDGVQAAAEDLARLHAAIAANQPVGFAYRDLDGEASARVVLPLALVHPPQGVKLLAWCRARSDFRQFFVRSVTQLSVLPGDFSQDRLGLLQGLVARYATRA